MQCWIVKCDAFVRVRHRTHTLATSKTTSTTYLQTSNSMRNESRISEGWMLPASMSPHNAKTRATVFVYVRALGTIFNARHSRKEHARWRRECDRERATGVSAVFVQSKATRSRLMSVTAHIHWSRRNVSWLHRHCHRRREHCSADRSLTIRRKSMQSAIFLPLFCLLSESVFAIFCFSFFSCFLLAPCRLLSPWMKLVVRQPAFADDAQRTCECRFLSPLFISVSVNFAPRHSFGRCCVNIWGQKLQFT